MKNGTQVLKYLVVVVLEFLIVFWLKNDKHHFVFIRKRRS